MKAILLSALILLMGCSRSPRVVHADGSEPGSGATDGKRAFDIDVLPGWSAESELGSVWLRQREGTWVKATYYVAESSTKDEWEAYSGAFNTLFDRTRSAQPKLYRELKSPIGAGGFMLTVAEPYQMGTKDPSAYGYIESADKKAMFELHFESPPSPKTVLEMKTMFESLRPGKQGPPVDDLH